MSRRYVSAITLSLLMTTTFTGSGPVAARQRPAVASAPQVPSEGATATRLADGHWLLVGGSGSTDATSTVSLFDPSTQVTIVLPSQLREPRSWHTATLLPDGSVLIVGGTGAHGERLSTAERFDPATETFTPLALQSAGGRSGHSATLLTDGQVLIVGGDADSSTTTAELWNVEARTITGVAGGQPRGSHTATLLGDGRVLISAGNAPSGSTAAQADEIFDPQTAHITPLTNPLPDDGGIPRIAETRPSNGATDVPLDVTLTLRLSHPVDPDMLSEQTMVLTGPQGTVSAQIVAAEGGRLLFVRPFAPLAADTPYVFTLTGVTDRAGVPAVAPPVRFTTINPPRTDEADPEPWIPNSSDAWRTNRPPSSWQSLPALHAEPGVTALAGQVLTLDGRPLPGVTLAIDADNTRSDGTGRFLLRVSTAGPGHHELGIDGATASRPNRTYGFFEYGVSLAAGQTTVLPFTIWMPRLDVVNQVTIPSPTVAETVLTTPYIPGLELHLPAGTVIRGRDGTTVKQLGITAIPVDRPPFPLAANVEVPVYFTIQPGGAYVQSNGPAPHGGWLVYPNYRSAAAPGQRIQFFHYDADVRGWYVYGLGTVKPDGTQVVPDRTTRLYEFSGAMINVSGYSPPATGWSPGAPGRAEPVDPSTGVFVMQKTDLYVPDVIPLAFTRSYNSGDTLARPVGRGMTHPYALYLWSALQYQEADLILPEGGKVHFVRTSAGTGFSDAVFVHQETQTTSATPTPFYKSVMTWNGNGWNLTLKDGTVYVFGENAPLQSIRDRYGNTVTVNHANGQSGNITSVSSSNGRSIAFTYDASNRITQATDSVGRIVSYTYDGNGNLSTVTDPQNHVTTYTYDTANLLATITDGRNIVYVTNTYLNGRIATQTLADPNASYQFTYTVDGNGNITQTDITDPRGHIERLAFNSNHYITSDTRALGAPEQQTITIERQTSSNLVTAVTDGLSRRTEYTYDGSGHVLTATRLAGTGGASTTTYTYEPVFSQVATVIDPLAHSWTFTYDAQGHLTRVADPVGHQTAIARNATGQVTSVTDPLQHSWQLGYANDDLTSVTDPLGRTWTRFVDSAGRVAAASDPIGAMTRAVLDSLNQRTSTTDSLGGQTTFSYDANGNLLSLTDALNHTTALGYDNSDRVVTRTDPLSQAVSYQYDLNGNLTQVTDRKAQVTSYTYDALDRVTQVTFADTSTIAYTYDAGNRLTQIVDSANGTMTRTYDGLDQFTEESTPQGTIDYTYDADGRRQTMTVSGQTTVSYGYDNAHRLTSITQGSSSVTITHDDANRRSAVTFPNGVAAAYGYDAANRLISLSYTYGGNTLGDLTYTYDASGHRTAVGGSWARTGLPPALMSATYDAGNRITTWGAAALSYDANGNMTGDGTNSYAWNSRDQLIGLSGATSASFAYDAAGRRRARTIGGTTTQFFYDGFNAVQELTSGGTPLVNLLIGLRVDETFTRTDSTGSSALLPDALGSTLALADASATVQTQYTFEPFGTTTSSGAASANAGQYTGRENDGTGLYFYRARYYSPQIERFISEDPLGFAFGTNTYQYGNNSPTNFIDPSGEAPIDYILPNWLVGHLNWRYVPAICNADSFRFYGGGGGRDSFLGGAYHLDDVHYSSNVEGWHVDGIESGTLVEAFGKEWGGGVVLSGRKPKEALLFPPSPYHVAFDRQLGPIGARAEGGIGPLIGYGSDGIAIGFYGDVIAAIAIGRYTGGFGVGGGWAVTFSSAAGCIAQ